MVVVLIDGFKEFILFPKYLVKIVIMTYYLTQSKVSLCAQNIVKHRLSRMQIKITVSLSPVATEFFDKSVRAISEVC